MHDHSGSQILQHLCVLKLIKKALKQAKQKCCLEKVCFKYITVQLTTCKQLQCFQFFNSRPVASFKRKNVNFHKIHSSLESHVFKTIKKIDIFDTLFIIASDKQLQMFNL